MTEPVLVEHRDNVALVTLNVPEKRNALGLALYRGDRLRFGESERC